MVQVQKKQQLKQQQRATAETTADADGKTYKIGVLQLVEHAALDASNEGFVAALNDSGISYENRPAERSERPVGLPDNR